MNIKQLKSFVDGNFKLIINHYITSSNVFTQSLLSIDDGLWREIEHYITFRKPFDTNEANEDHIGRCARKMFDLFVKEDSESEYDFYWDDVRSQLYGLIQKMLLKP